MSKVREDPFLLLAVWLVIIAATAMIALPLALVAGAGWLIFVFIRWFIRSQHDADERERKAATARLLQEQVEAAAIPDRQNFVIDTLAEAFADRSFPCDALIEAFGDIALDLYSEDLQRPGQGPAGDGIDAAIHRDNLRDFITKADDIARYRRTIIRAVRTFCVHLPPAAFDDEPSLFQTPLLGGPDTGALLEHFILPFYADDTKPFFKSLRERLDANQKQASYGKKDLVLPSDYDGDVRTFVVGTPLIRLFEVSVPFSVPAQARSEHTHIVASSGHGKTQLLQQLVLGDLRHPDPPALIIIDSQGDMLRKIARLDLFETGDRLVMIDPEDDWSPALNMFDMSTARLQSYSRLVREQVEAGIIELYNYVFGALAAELTSKQGTAFAFVARLMMSIPGATIHTLRELMEEDARTLHDSRFADAIAALDPTARAFFENQFYNRSAFVQTRQQIARRLYGVLQVPAFDRMLSSTHSRLDMFAAMQDGKVVLVNTSKSLLKSEASALFGRFMIAQALRAAYERVAVPERERRPAFLIIDEASEYFDDSLETLLNQARKFNLGIVFAHQYVDQLSMALRASVAANTSIKMAGGVSDRDARMLAPDMRTSPEFLAAQRKDSTAPPHWTQFACYVRNHTPSAVSLAVPFGELERAPTMGTAAFDRLRQHNRQRYATNPDEPRHAPTGLDRPSRAATAAPPVDGGDWRS